MFSRYIVMLCIVLVTFFICIHADIQETDSLKSAQAKFVAKIIGSLFTSSASNCLLEAASECQSYWKNPSRALNCGKKFLETNKGRCLIG